MDRSILGSKMKGSAMFPPFDPFQPPSSGFAPYDDTSGLPYGTGGHGSRTRQPSVYDHSLAPQSSLYPPHEYDAYRQSTGMPMMSTLFPSGSVGAHKPHPQMYPGQRLPGYPLSSMQSKRKPSAYSGVDELGSPLSGASFGGFSKGDHRKVKSGSKSGSGSSKSGGKSDGKKMRRRRDVDWRVRGDEQAYQKVLRNRQAAARSNEKRRRVRQEYDSQIGGLREQRDSLTRKEQQLREENQSLRARIRYGSRKP